MVQFKKQGQVAQPRAFKRTAGAVSTGGDRGMGVAVSQLEWQRQPARLGPKALGAENRSMSPNQAQEPIRTFHSKLATLEVTLWLILALLISGRPLLFLILYPRDISMVFRNFYLELLAGVICVLFPFIFRLTFSHFPLQLIRRSRESQTVHKRQLEENTLPSNPRGQSEAKVSTTAIYPAPATTSGYMELL